jgi:4-amino-4-deoxy-L-arabinose transferase-like glycosyltransferase
VSRWARLSGWATVALLLVAFGLALTSARVKSATFDEEAYIGKGTAIWKEGNYWLRTAHPTLAPMLNTLPLLLEPEVTPPTEHHCWPDGSGRSCGRVMLFYQGDTQRTLLLTRLPTLFLMLILGSLAYRWAADLFGPLGGLVTLALCVFDPNLLAHGRLVTLDFATTFTFFLTFFALYRFWRRPGWGRSILTGIALGAAGATRYTAGTLLLPFVLLCLARVWRPAPQGAFPALAAPSRWRRLAVALLLLAAMSAIAAFTVWVIHGADFGPVPRWGDIQLPAPAYFNDLAALLEYRDKPQDAFLLGRHYVGGWWPYFVVAFLVKTPLPTILLIAVAIVGLIKRRDGRLGEVVLLVFAGYYFVLSLVNPFNIGYRHLLPLLPFLFVFAARVVRPFARASRPWLRAVPVALLGWLAVANLAIYPHYLAYFNELVGPRNGYRVLVDSNLDWGQDLPALEKYVKEHDVPSLYLSWFGESRPWQYNIPYRSIPSKPDELSDLYTRVYHPDYPPPGTYAISATNLQALLFDDKELFGWFLQREPVAQPGYSVMIYEVPHLLDSDAPPVTVALGDRQIDQVPADAFEMLWHTNDLHLRWYNTQASCILPSEDVVWYVLDADIPLDLPLCPLWEEAEWMSELPMRGGEGQSLAFYRLQTTPAMREDWFHDLAAASPVIVSDEVAFGSDEAPELRREITPPLRLGDRLDLIGYRALSARLEPGSEWQFVSYWQVTGLGSEVEIFVQLLDDGGNVRAQYDGLDIPAVGWQEGDFLAQRHTLSLPDDLSPGRYWVQFGVYDVETGNRLPVLVDDISVGTRLLLPAMEVR